MGKDSMSYTMGEKREEKNRHDSPGPGTYEAKTEIVKEKITTVKISHTAKRSIFEQDDGKLGPGVYDP